MTPPLGWRKRPKSPDTKMRRILTTTDAKLQMLAWHDRRVVLEMLDVIIDEAIRRRKIKLQPATRQPPDARRKLPSTHARSGGSLSW